MKTLVTAIFCGFLCGCVDERTSTVEEPFEFSPPTAWSSSEDKPAQLESFIHVTESGQTLLSIARMHRVDVNDLAELNKKMLLDKGGQYYNDPSRAHWDKCEEVYPGWENERVPSGWTLIIPETRPRIVYNAN